MVIGRPDGFHLRVHILLWPALVAAGLLGGLPRLLTLFAVVLLHELCHALVARLCGFRVSAIEVLPVGCVARIDGLFAGQPRCEAAIALAGPFFNLLAAAGLFALDFTGLWVSALNRQLVAMNLAIALFNLQPGLPLDGGRVLRALLAREMSLTRATRIAAVCGVVCGALLTAWSVWMLFEGAPAWLTCCVGVFFIMAACREYRSAPWLGLKEVADKKDALRQRETLSVRQIAAPASLPLSRLVRRFVPSRYHVVLVLNEDFSPLGVVSEARVVDAMMHHGAMTPLGALLGKTVDPTGK